MTPEHFSELAAQGYNRIPVTREVLADLDTPLSTYLKLANGTYSYLLDPVSMLAKLLARIGAQNFETYIERFRATVGNNSYKVSRKSNR